MKRIVCFLGVALALAGCSTLDPCVTNFGALRDYGTKKNPEQCWKGPDIIRFYTTTQGSHLVRYELVMPLELAVPDPKDPEPDTEKKKLKILDEPFFTKTHIEERWRFLALEESEWDQQSDVYKEDIKTGWPVGFTVDKRTSGKAEWRGEWLGLTCAACHTAQIEHKGEKLRIEGGPTMADVNRFLKDLQRSLAATVEDGEKNGAKFQQYKDRYEKKFKSVPNDLLDRLKKASAERNAWHQSNDPPIPAGYARLDAFGDIFNAVLQLLGKKPVNRSRPNAPVSYPFLWDTSHHNWTQWNGYSTAIPIGRNVGQALGVFAKVDPDCGFLLAHLFLCEPSTIRIDNQKEFQELVDKLRSPKWPDKYFGTPVAGMVSAGKSLFVAHCAHCHGEQKREEPLKGNDMAIIEVEHLGTDPTTVQNTNRRMALQRDKKFLRDQEEVKIVRVQDQVGDVLFEVLAKSALSTVAKEWFWSCFIGRLNCGITNPVVEGYKGRPLDGIWATAPYLHNGSVPNLYYLLKPPAQRPKGFCVGSREFDPKHVGFQMLDEKACKDKELFWFDTTKEGNSNAGHHGPEYGGDLSEDEILQLIEYMKTL